MTSAVALPDGTHVNTAAIERALRDSPYIALAFVSASNGVLHADVAIDRNGVSSWAAERRLPFTTLSSLVRLDEVRQLIADEVALLAPDVVHHDLLNRPLQQGREITRTGKTIHGGPNTTTDAGPAPVPRNEAASAIE
jgi:long-subunit acyl-CoA synthetase (AMP-forming)